jgi:predicted molibdopterin-dependent oxidoreductase YjgC
VAGLATAYGSGAATNSIEGIRESDVIFVLGSNTSAQHPLVYARITAAHARGAKLIVADPRITPVAALADKHLRIKTGTNLALINALMHVILAEGLHNEAFIAERTENFAALQESLAQCTPEWAEGITGICAEDIRQTARLYAAGSSSVIIYCMGVTQHVTGTRTCAALANLTMLCGMVGRPSTGLMPLRGQNNVQGSCDMGALPETLPGYVAAGTALAEQRFAPLWGNFANTKGRKLTEIMAGMVDGSIRAAWVMGENPAQSDPDAASVMEGLGKLDFLVVQDLFLTPTARMAHVVLPAASYLEKQGTFTNTERRVQMVNEVLPPVEGSRADWQILRDAIRALGGQADYTCPEDIFEEIKKLVPSYAGMSYARIAQAQGLCWPCPTPEHPGTPVLHSTSFTRGLGLFTVNTFTLDDMGEQPCAEYPYLLITGRESHQYHTGTMTRRSWALDREFPEAFLDVHPDDALALKIKENWMVTIRSRRGSITARVRISRNVQPGTVFLPFHYAESSANVLTGHHYCDPVAGIPALKMTAVAIEEKK